MICRTQHQERDRQNYAGGENFTIKLETQDEQTNDSNYEWMNWGDINTKNRWLNRWFNTENRKNYGRLITQKTYI